MARYWKRSVFIPIPKKVNAKECSNYRTIVLISHASKVMLKILQARLQQYMNFQMEVQDVQDVQSGFRKGRRTRDQIASICWVIEKARKISTSALLTAPKLLLDPYSLLWKIQQTVENSSRDGTTRQPHLPLEKSVCRSGNNS